MTIQLHTIDNGKSESYNIKRGLKIYFVTWNSLNKADLMQTTFLFLSLLYCVYVTDKYWGYF